MVAAIIHDTEEPFEAHVVASKAKLNTWTMQSPLNKDLMASKQPCMMQWVCSVIERSSMQLVTDCDLFVSCTL